MRLIKHTDISWSASAGITSGKAGAPEKDPRRGRSIGGIGIDERGDERWAEATRWVVRGSRLPSHFPIVHVLEGMPRGPRITGQSGSPPNRPFFPFFAPFRGYFDS
jgi:hypothetical protein